MSVTYKYPRPAVTADLVIVAREPKGDRVLLIQRGNDPYKGHWALPGGFVDENEDLVDAAARELEEETGLTGVELKQVGAYGKPGRDPRGHTVTIAFSAIIAEVMPVRAGDDASMALWFPVNALPSLAFDHDEIITDALKSIEGK
jgi:8-oxo-dGTP diphosphatase